MEKLKGKVQGKLVDDKERPLSGIQLRATADYSSILTKDNITGSSVTDNQGYFEIDFTSNKEFMENDKNQIKIEFFIDEEPIMDISSDIRYGVIDFGTIKYDQGNIGVEGRVIDEKGNPVEGLTVIAEDVDYGKMELNMLNLIESKFKSFIKQGFLSDSMDFIKGRYEILLPFRDDFLGTVITDKSGYYRIIYPPGRYREILDKEPDIKIIVKDKLGVFEL